MATPFPAFPARVATDADLKVGNNRIQTKLRVAIDATNTALFVDSVAGFTANMLCTIDKEIVAIGSVVSAPNAQLIVASGGRGFDGTMAAAHSAGARVAVLIDAWHHNALAAEIKAIEEFIGPGGQNIGTGYPFLVASAFHFGPQTPGVPLAPGNNVIALAPVPTGVNGSDVGHYLWISGGTGAAEAVPITGGTAVSGAPSGTVIINCANAHSGAWTIASATGGLQEAVNSVTPDGATIVIPNDITLHADVVPGGKNIAIHKFPGAAIGNAETFRIFTSKNSWGVTGKAETISTDGIALAGASSADTVPFAGSPYQAAAVSAARSTNHDIPLTTEENCLWVQEDFNGATGTPVALRSVLFAPKLISSQGACAVAGYAYLGWTTSNVAGSGTQAIGVHGQCDAFNGTAGRQNVAVGLNAEGSYTPLGIDPGPPPIIIGVVSNMGGGNAGNATMVGVEVISNPNPGGSNSEGGIKVHATTSGTHQYGLKISDDGGQYVQPVVIATSQANSPTINISNTAGGLGAASSSINFFRGDFLASHHLVRVSAENINDFGSGVLKIATANGSTMVTALTVDQTQVITVAKSIKTTGITVAQLPPSAGATGSWACVTDATVTTIGTAVAGGGANTVGVFCGPGGWKIVAN